MFDVYADGSFYYSKEYGAWAAGIYQDEKLISEQSGQGHCISAEMAEILAVQLGLSMLPRSAQVRVYSDASIIFRLVDFANDEKKISHWLSKKSREAQYSLLIKTFYECISGRKLEWIKVRSSGPLQHRRVDRMCRWEPTKKNSGSSFNDYFRLRNIHSSSKYKNINRLLRDLDGISLVARDYRSEINGEELARIAESIRRRNQLLKSRIQSREVSTTCTR